jgi:hypothetical protein
MIAVLKFKLFILFVTCICLNIFVSMKLSGKSLKAARADLAPSKKIVNFGFGYKEQIADLIWLKSIQDFDYCDRVQSVHANGFQICAGNSYLFRLLDVVSDLSPRFRMVYAAGGLALSVVITDVEGATKIFDKGVNAFSKDWPLLYRAAYHAMIEEKNKKKAAGLLIEAARSGGPDWLVALAGRMYIESGAIDLSKKIIEELENSPDGQQFADRIRKRLEEHQKVD